MQEDQAAKKGDPKAAFFNAVTLYNVL